MPKSIEAGVRMVDAVVLFTPRLEKSLKFYRAIGIPLMDERHGKGPPHAACDLGATHFAIYDGAAGRAPARGKGGHTMIGFRVPSLKRAVAAARQSGSRILIQPQSVPWGRRAIVMDPDGRSVELNEASDA